MPVRKVAAAVPSEPRLEPLQPALPALETITAFLCKRAPAFASDPLEVPRELFEAGKAEMADVMKRRGFPLPTSADCPFVNFLLLGKIIVQGD